jgi:hypothetical protein
MTAETSNALGDVVAVPKDVIDFLMGEGELQGAWYGEQPDGENGEWFWRKHLRKARDAAPPPAAARGDVRGLVAKWQECYSNDDGDSWFDHPADAEFVDGLGIGDKFELTVSHYAIRRTYVVTKAPDDENDDYEVEHVEALAAEGVQAGEVEQRLLADLKAAWFKVCDALDEVDPDWMMGDKMGADAAAAKIRALSQQPEARGVVGEEAVESCESGLPDCGHAVTWDSEGVGVCERCGRELGWLPALTGERNG